MQFVKCKFRENDTRAYTYQWDGEPLEPGDIVRIEDNRNPGWWKRVWVVETTNGEPDFACKPILGRWTGEDTDATIHARVPDAA
jgi:hypothetical protein